jgi:hypothetical protein
LVGLIIQLRIGRCTWISSEWKIDLTNWEDKLVKLSQLVKNSDNDIASPLVKSSLQTKDIENKNYNYLERSISSKETNLGSNPKGGTKSPPNAKSLTDIVFISQVKKLKYRIDSEVRRGNDSSLSTKTDEILKGILYYLHNYRLECGALHPRYKEEQVYDCMIGFCRGIKLIERSTLPVEDTLIKVIDRWFETTNDDPNNLRLSHFVGRNSSIFRNCLIAVIADSDLRRKEKNANF